jgi:hypothetical protein
MKVNNKCHLLLLPLLVQCCLSLVQNTNRVKPSTSTPSSDTATTNNNNNNNILDQRSINLSYASYWENLLSEEYRANAEELKERRNKWSRSRLEAAGMSIFGASAEPDSEVFGDKIVKIYKNNQGRNYNRHGNNGKLMRESFSRGDVLVLTPEMDSGLGRRTDYPIIPRECLVVDVGNDWLTVAVGPTWPIGLWETRKKNTGAFLVRLDRTAPQAPMKAQRDALEKLRLGEGGKAASILAGLLYGGPNTDHYLYESSDKPSHYVSSNDNDNEFDNNGNMMDQDLSSDVWNALKEAKKEMSFEPNQSQMDAIAWALQRRVSLIRGPPGTGKTRCAALLIATALKMKTNFYETESDNKGDDNEDGGDVDNSNDDHTKVESENEKPISTSTPPRILAVAHSNGAADVLLEALLNIGVPAVRLGRPSSVSPNVQHRTVIAITEKLPAIVKLRQKASDTSLERQDRSAAAFELKQYMGDLQKAIMNNAPVVVASCIGANKLLNENVSFPIVVLDEAAQTTEPALICPLAGSKAEQVVLIGDTRQLPPTITAMDLRNNLGVSPMSRLENDGVDQVTLSVQYRMPPSLLEHPSSYFYGGLVSCAEENKSKDIDLPSGFPWPNSIPLAFIQSGNNNEIAHNFGGKSNPTEAALVVRIISDLIDDGDIDARNIAVITPYSKQVQLIRMELSSKERGGRNSMHQVKVGTVDSFQGQETDLVIFSAVRSNEIKEMGFLRDSRRLNVAITRAKRGLILIGDRVLLRTCRHWAALLESCETRECLMDATALDQQQKQEPLSLEETHGNENDLSQLDDSDEFYGLFTTK